MTKKYIGSKKGVQTPSNKAGLQAIKNLRKIEMDGLYNFLRSLIEHVDGKVILLYNNKYSVYIPLIYIV